MAPTPELSLIIACYNESETIEETLPRVKRFLDQIRVSFELIVIDDLSKDNTTALLEKVLVGYPVSNFVKHQKNTGRGGVIKEGILLAKGKTVGFLDIDLEVPEHYILPCMMLMNQNDMVIVTRLYNFHWYSIMRWFTGIVYIELMQFFTGIRYKDTEGGYKFFNREKILKVIEKSENNHWFFDTELVCLAHFMGLKIAELPVVFTRRNDKTSTVRLFRDSYLHFVALWGFRKKLKREGFL